MAAAVSPLRAKIGAEVAARLQAADAQCARTEHFSLWYVDDFLDAADCDFLMGEIDRHRQPSILLDDAPQENFRTSESGNLNRWDERVRAIDRRICALMGLEERQGETLQGQRYAPGQFFRTHHDFFHTDQSYFAEEQKCGGQRTWTAMIFLNGTQAGGETNFPYAGLKVAPRPGLLLMWDNMTPDGAPNLYAAHEGCAVEAGVKYIVTKWFREGSWV